ncbi:MAG: heme NO-binding domain-containing protein [Halioglobus sp.]|nr:heme NO-binding domain-containing protein [Halioglobus sp.]
MYGLINSSLKSMIIQNYGEESWRQVLISSGVPEDSFLAMRSYDDSVTYALIEAASDFLQTPVDKCLEMFGEFWVLETAAKSYEELLSTTGRTMVEFLQNMNQLHDRITSTLLDYVPPEFSVEEKGAHYLIHYRSQRQGLIAFVVGLLNGLAIRFNCQINIVSIKEEQLGQGTHAIFETRIS